MIDKLKFLIDECEDNPRLKELFLKVASLSEKGQEAAIELIEFVVNNALTERFKYNSDSDNAGNDESHNVVKQQA